MPEKVIETTKLYYEESLFWQVPIIEYSVHADNWISNPVGLAEL